MRDTIELQPPAPAVPVVDVDVDIKQLIFSWAEVAGSTHYKLKDIAELITIAAFVASLIFVGIQIRQTHQIALAGQYQARAVATMDMYMALQQSGTSIAALSKPVDEMTPEELSTLTNVDFWLWTQYDNHHFQYKAGFLDEDSWVGLSRRIINYYANCDRRSVYDSL